MTAERHNCSLSSLLPMSCRDRAESFARRLHSRLTSLGSQDGNCVADESSWLGARDASVAVSQPRHSAEQPDLFLDFGLLESPGSPEEEVHAPDFTRVINNNLTREAVKRRVSSVDSDSSECSFYDLESDSDQRGEWKGQVNGVCETCGSGDKSKEGDSEEDTTPLLDNLSDGSTLSPPEEDPPPVCGLQNGSDEVDYARLNGSDTYCSHLNVDKDLTVECTYISEASLPEDDEPSKKSVSDDEDLEPTPRVRRCSSLKTGKTPPGTPGSKKIVRFADVLGLDLADVRTFLDEIPKVPNSAYEDLKDADLNEDDPSITTLTNFPIGNPRHADKLLVSVFQQPGGQPDFLDKVRTNQVCLENAVVSDPITLAISGTVRVRNLDFNKSVHIRYSLDAWKTFADVQGNYVQNSCDGFSDTFSFLMYANNLAIGQRLEFAVRFQCKGCQYWDNNQGANYCFQCLPSTQMSASYYPGPGGRDWAASFY